jgi:hypothetical protein
MALLLGDQAMPLRDERLANRCCCEKPSMHCQSDIPIPLPLQRAPAADQIFTGKRLRNSRKNFEYWGRKVYRKPRLRKELSLMTEDTRAARPL